MKKNKFGYKLNRSSGARRALFRSLSKALIVNGSIKTTYTKAAAVKPEIEKLVKLAKNDDLASRRRVYSMLGNDRETSYKLVKEVAVLFKGMVSGYTKVEELGRRKGDDARIVRFSWSVRVKESEKKRAKGKKATKTKTKEASEKPKTKTVDKIKSRFKRSKK